MCQAARKNPSHHDHNKACPGTCLGSMNSRQSKAVQEFLARITVLETFGTDLPDVSWIAASTLSGEGLNEQPGR